MKRLLEEFRKLPEYRKKQNSLYQPKWNILFCHCIRSK